MDKKLSTRVKEICSDRGMTLKDLAAKMGIKPESLSRALNGNPQLSTLENIAKALSVQTSDLLGVRDCAELSPDDFTAMVFSRGKAYLFNTRNDLRSWLSESS